VVWADLQRSVAAQNQGFQLSLLVSCVRKSQLPIIEEGMKIRRVMDQQS